MFSGGAGDGRVAAAERDVGGRGSLRFLTRRVLFYILTAWAAITLNFAIPRLMPGNPVQALLARFRGQISPAATASFTKLFGLNNAGLWSQYWTYLSHLAHGDLGISFSYYPSTVSQVILTSLPWTAVLIGAATILSFVLGTVLGIMSGWWRGSWMDSLLPVTTFLGSIPYFWFGLLAVFFLSVHLGWFPLSGGSGTTTPIALSGAFLASASYHAVLPAATIVVSSVGGWMLGMRNMMVTTQSEDYVLMAEARGLSRRRIMVTYAARNAILPSLASFAMSLGFVVSGAILVEIVFSYPGLGYVLFQAVTNNDYPLMQGVFLIITMAVLGANFVADLVYVLLDPRTRQVR
jgi:peptide/nickel transport system permease protein